MQVKKVDDEIKTSIKNWLDIRGLETHVVDYLPENGLCVCSDSGAPIVAGFIRKVEGGFGLIGEYISDPEQEAHKRDNALNLLTIELIGLAKSLGILTLIGYSANIMILLRAEKFGFKRLPETLIRLDLIEGE